MPQYPGYHTAIDNMEHMVRFVDPTFRAHATLARVVGEMALRLATHTKLPLDIRELAVTLEEGCNGLLSLVHTESGPQLSNIGQ